MMDQGSIAKLMQGYPDLAVRAHRLWQDVHYQLGLALRITEVLRTVEYQEQLYAKGRARTPDGGWVVVDSRLIVTKALPGSSIHHFGLAFDVCFAGKDPYLEALRKAKGDAEWDGIWRTVGRLAKAHGLVWGFDWDGDGVKDPEDFDRPHFQITYGLALKEIQDLYRHGGIAAVWAQCDRIRNVSQGSEWNGIATKRELVDAGILPA